MPPFSYRKLQPGDHQVSANDLNNAMATASQTAKLSGPGTIGEGGLNLKPPMPPRFMSAGLVLVQNNSGSNIELGEVLGIDDALIPPDVDVLSFAFSPKFAGVVPNIDDHLGKFAVSVSHIPNGGIGLACVSGVCVTKVDFGDGDERFADIVNGSTANLTAGVQGSAEVLWKESGTGVKWAEVRISNTGVLVPFPAALTSNAGGVYGWQEMSPQTSGVGWSIKTGGRTSAEFGAATEFNDRYDIKDLPGDANPVVVMYLLTDTEGNTRARFEYTEDEQAITHGAVWAYNMGATVENQYWDILECNPGSWNRSKFLKHFVDPADSDNNNTHWADLPADIFIAKIVQYYDWTEQESTVGGALQDMPGGRTGTNAQEINGQVIDIAEFPVYALMAEVFDADGDPHYFFSVGDDKHRVKADINDTVPSFLIDALSCTGIIDAAVTPGGVADNKVALTHAAWDSGRETEVLDFLLKYSGKGGRVSFGTSAPTNGEDYIKLDRHGWARDMQGHSDLTSEDSIYLGFFAMPQGTNDGDIAQWDAAAKAWVVASPPANAVMCTDENGDVVWRTASDDHYVFQRLATAALGFGVVKATD